MQKRGFFSVTRRSDFSYRLDVLFYASLIAPLILFFFGIKHHQGGGSFPQHYAEFPSWLVWFLVVGYLIVFLMGDILYRKKILDAKSQVVLRWKVQRFLKAISYKHTSAAFSGSFAALCYYLTGEWQFALVVMGIISVLFLQRPNLKKVSKKLNLNTEEIALFRSEQTWN